MKTRLFTIALLLGVALSGFAQDKTSLKAATKKMIDLSDMENYNDLVGTVYPKYFDVLSKDDYYSQLQKKMKGNGYLVHPIRIEPSIDYGAVKKVDGITFCLVNYDVMQTIELENKLAPQDVKAKEDYFKKLFNTEDVYYIENNNTIDVKRRIQLVALADDSTYQQWTFLDPKAPGANEILHDVIRKELDPDNTIEPEANNVSTNTATTQQMSPENEKWEKDKRAEYEKQKSAKKKTAPKKS